jgi:adenosylcobinamide kinase/adenosylcobinamide-phosphate guanylyltransferase
MAETFVSELVLGGQKSGKSRHAEARAQAWLAADARHRVVFVATGVAGDAEMAERIRKHQADRAQRLPGVSLVEEPRELARAIEQHSRPDTLVLVDCLTLWLTQRLMPLGPEEPDTHPGSLIDGLCAAVGAATGPVVLVSNEIGWGVIPLGSGVRSFVDTLGRLNQAVAAVCPRVTLVAAGLSIALKTP